MTVFDEKTRVGWAQQDAKRRNQSHPTYDQFAKDEKTWQILDKMEEIASAHGRRSLVPLCRLVTSWHGNAFRITGTDPLWGDSTSDRWILLTKDSDWNFDVFFVASAKQVFEQKVEYNLRRRDAHVTSQ